MTPQSRAPLSRDAVVDAAIEYVDQHGLGALTMRQLGQLLGVEAMSIYHYVNGREDLLEAVVSRLVDQVTVPPYEDSGPANGWQWFLQHMAHAIRSVAVEHPALFPLVATRPPAAPWLRPPLRSLELVDSFLGGLVDRGLSDAQAVYVYKVFTSFLLGNLLLEVAARGEPVATNGEPLDDGGGSGGEDDEQLTLDDYPTLVRLADDLQKYDPDVDFDEALEAWLDRLDSRLSL